MSHVKSVFGHTDTYNTYKDRFKHSQCLLLISVGQETHENERFETTINLINNSFAACIILLYDSLQRHTMALNSIKEPNHFHKAAVKEGDIWLERNKKYYSKLTILKKIERWDMWLTRPDFLAKKSELTSLIDDDPSYKKVFNDTIDGYLTKYCKRLTDLSSFDHKRAWRICFDYLLEECTVLCLWPELQCHFEVYPNKHSDAMEETRKRLIRPYFPDLLHAVTIRFRNAKQVKPQYFKLLESENEI